MIWIPLLAFACWGSFLNSLAYRLVHLETLHRLRSFCPTCDAEIAWYDNIPLISWILLRGKCRHCNQTISALYPFIEILTVILLYALTVQVTPAYWFSYFVFFSALIVSVRTDLETMLISRFVSVALIPVGMLFAYHNLLPISLQASLHGALFGYAILFGLNALFYFFTKRQGMGQGDFELLAMIGSFTGVSGAWISLLLGSVLGSLTAIAYMIIFRLPHTTKMPFGPFLAFGAFSYVLFGNVVVHYLLAV